MPLRALPPQGSASANFATWAVVGPRGAAGGRKYTDSRAGIQRRRPCEPKGMHDPLSSRLARARGGHGAWGWNLPKEIRRRTHRGAAPGDRGIQAAAAGISRQDRILEDLIPASQKRNRRPASLPPIRAAAQRFQGALPQLPPTGVLLCPLGRAGTDGRIGGSNDGGGGGPGAGGRGGRPAT